MTNPVSPVSRGQAWNAMAPLLWLLSPLAVIFTVVIALNLYVNPLSLYSSKRFNPAQMNYRAEKFARIKALPVAPETIIQGSSRVMTMYSSDVERYLPGKCYNTTGLGARAEDFYAGLRVLCEDAHAPVKRMVLGLDFEAFCPKVQTMSEARYFPEYQKYLSRSPVSRPSLAERLSLLVSMQQTNQALAVLRRESGNRAGPTLEIGPGGEALQTERDRAIAEGRFDLQRVLDRRLRKYPLQSLNSAVFDRADPLRLAYLCDMLDYCRARGIDVYAYFTPYHPQLWAIIDPLPVSAVLDQVRYDVGKCFTDRGFVVHDYSHIAAFGGDPDAFYDEVHMQRSNQQRLLNKLFEGMPLQPERGAP
jgi:hypothetical protein